MCYPKGSGGSPQLFPGRDGVIWYVGSVSGWLSQWWLVCVPLEVGVTLGLEFEKTCSVSGKWNVSNVFPRLYGWVYKIFRFPLLPLVLELRVTIMRTHAQWVPNCGFPLRGTAVWILWVPNFWFWFYETCVQN